MREEEWRRGGECGCGLRVRRRGGAFIVAGTVGLFPSRNRGGVAHPGPVRTLNYCYCKLGPHRSNVHVVGVGVLHFSRVSSMVSLSAGGVQVGLPQVKCRCSRGIFHAYRAWFSLQVGSRTFVYTSGSHVQPLRGDLSLCAADLWERVVWSGSGCQYLGKKFLRTGAFLWTGSVICA